MTKDEYNRVRAMLNKHWGISVCPINSCPCTCAGSKNCIDSILYYLQTGNVERCFPNSVESTTTHEPLSEDEISQLLMAISQGDV